eukprot:gnl/MRDRNA2_/MRDRNA2_143869_c0_seq1.p1 gnl/MRDRNA2_/MRDRNA2_143869_c0~~gnl/MRDRNA2_/MRDRNA2_143869_c0_seq1.p1  ORF type:complete len:334 (-),score=53.32 gnl/MRDRNA2_/MRDRNA2_143869_c0_seq1:250-1104(-)
MANHGMELTPEKTNGVHSNYTRQVSSLATELSNLDVTSTNKETRFNQVDNNMQQGQLRSGTHPGADICGVVHPSNYLKEKADPEQQLPATASASILDSTSSTHAAWYFVNSIGINALIPEMLPSDSLSNADSKVPPVRISLDELLIETPRFYCSASREALAIRSQCDHIIQMMQIRMNQLEIANCTCNAKRAVRHYKIRLHDAEGKYSKLVTKMQDAQAEKRKATDKAREVQQWLVRLHATENQLQKFKEEMQRLGDEMRALLLVNEALRSNGSSPRERLRKTD